MRLIKPGKKKKPAMAFIFDAATYYMLKQEEWEKHLAELEAEENRRRMERLWAILPGLVRQNN